MGLEIRLLGPPRVVRDGVAVTFETRKAVALLAHLALSELPRSREQLCELLYPGHDPERARGALRRTLSTLRTGIGAERIEAGANGIALTRSRDVVIDVERFRRRSARSSANDLAGALEEFAGSFLEGFALRDSPEFDSWQQSEAGALDRELAAVLRRRIEQLVGDGDVESALPLGRRWLDLDPLHEPAHRELIRLYAWSGDRAAALEQYRACVRVLSADLGVAPVSETTSLFEQVYDGALAAPLPTEPLPSPLAPVATTADPPVTELPLTGRTTELAALETAFADALPDGGVVVIEGEAGIGKSRLAHELVTRAREAGGVALVAQCHDDEAGLPYGPVIDLLHQAARLAPSSDWIAGVPDHSLADAALLLPELATLRPGMPAPLPLSGPGAPVRLLDGVATVLAAACRSRVAGVIVLDDIHAADEATLDAIVYLSRRLRQRALLLVVCWRSEAVPPGHRVRRLAGEHRTTTVRPTRLEESEVAGLVRSALEDVAPDLEHRVFVESEGLPLFVSEYLAAASAGTSADGVLVAEVRSLLDRRLTGLGDVARQVLGAAAALGRSFDFELVRRASGRSEEEVVTALEDLVARGVVRDLGGPEPLYDFSHSKLRELAYEQMGLARRRLLHGRIAAAVKRDPAGASAGLIASHLQLSGDVEGAAEQHRLAAEHAVSVHAHADALEHLGAALALGLTDAAGTHERIGDLRTVTGDYGGAVASYEAAAAFGEPDDRARIEHKCGNVHQRRGEWERAEARFSAALEAVPAGAEGLHARILADYGLTLHHAGERARAIALAGEALELAEAAGDLQAEAQAHNILGVISRGEGDRDAALVHLQRSLGLAGELGDGPAESAALNNLALVERDVEEYAGALDLTTRALALAARYGDRHREAALENNLADLHHAMGDEESAMTHLKRAVTLFRDVGADDATRLPEIW
ncbi:MAG: ATP-binding protein, partial [Marmoricola sp.]